MKLFVYSSEIKRKMLELGCSFDKGYRISDYRAAKLSCGHIEIRDLQSWHFSRENNMEIICSCGVLKSKVAECEFCGGGVR